MSQEQPLVISWQGNGLKLFGVLVKELRELNELTTAEVAGAIGVHVSFIRGIERGVQSPSMETAEKLFVCFTKNHGFEWVKGEAYDLSITNPDTNEIVCFKFKAKVRGQNHRVGTEGFWFVYHSDFSGFAIFNSELDALRHAVDNHMQVKFLLWGQGRHDAET